MSQVLRQSTQIVVHIGPFVDVTDGFTPEVLVALTTADEAEIMKGGATTVTDISAATWAAITGADGWYNLTLTTSHTDTVGPLTVIVNDDSVCLPVFARFQVIEEAAYDALYAAAAPGPATPTNITAGTITTATNVTTVNGLAANVITAASIAADAITDAKVASDVTIASVTGSVGSVVGLTASNLDATISSRMATYVQPTGFLAATFPTGTVANTTNITAATGIVLSGVTHTGAVIPTVTTTTTATNLTTNNDKTGYALSAAGVTAIWAEVMDGTRTAVQAMRGFMAALLGKASGLPTAPKYRNIGDTVNVIDATTDSDGNRTAVTLDLT